MTDPSMSGIGQPSPVAMAEDEAGLALRDRAANKARLSDPALRAAYIRSRQAEGQAIASYHLRAVVGGGGDVYAAEHAKQGYRARIGSTGMSVRVGDEDMTLSLRGVACGERLQAAGRPRVRADRHRVELTHGALTEWYANGPLGLEQGFDLAARPDCGVAATPSFAEAGLDIRIELALSGSLKPRAEGSGLALYRAADLRVAGTEQRAFPSPALRYAELYASDADGKPLSATMELSADGQRLALLVKDAGARYPLHIDPLTYVEQKILTASNKAAGDQLGTSVALSGDGNRALVGAMLADPGGLADAGAAYVYTRDATGTWTEEKILTASNKAAGDRFGRSVALSGDGGRALVGADFAAPAGLAVAGAVYVYARDAMGTWTEETILTASDKAGGATFGASVALSSDGSRALVGADHAAPAGLGAAGAAYVYTRDAMASWAEEAILTASNKAASDLFATSVALSSTGSRALVGAIGSDPGGVTSAGAAFVYTRDAMGNWSEEAILSASNKAAADQFGGSVSLAEDGSRALVGAMFAAPGGTFSAGSAYVYTRAAVGTWSEEAILVASNKAMSDLFGSAVSLSGDGNRALVGSRFADPGGLINAGTAYVYGRTLAGLWPEEAILSASNRQARDAFGFAVALSSDGRRALVGANTADPVGVTDAGAAYVFTEGKINGSACGAGSECVSGFCVDGVCCNTACGAGMDTDCQACATAKGAAVNGTCGTTTAAANFICRPSAGGCDVAEKCTGASTACPADAKQPNTFACRPSGGACDIAETCDGTTNACPADAKRSNTFVCRTAGGVCDVAETCDGTTNACPADAKQPNTFACRLSAGACDATETCDGTTNACPPDTKQPNTFVCRPSGGGCDVAESCDGTTNACPADVKRSNTFVCRPSGGACDVAESCDGTTDACPADAKQPSSVTCRAASGVCDVAESCDGTSNACPPDQKKSSLTVCRAAIGVCDAAETCDGSNSACPIDTRKPAGTMCKVAGASATCDPADFCDGVRTTCPANFAAYGTSCGTGMSCSGTGRCQ